MDLQVFADALLLVIDGSLQSCTQRVDLRAGLRGGTRVYARWAVPESKLEWDGRESAYHCRTHRVSVISGGSILASGDARCVHFAVGQASPSKQVVARALFVLLGPKVLPEAPTLPPARTDHNPFGYGREGQ